MRRSIALLLVAAALTQAADIDPCDRQPFRGRCPNGNGVQTRSQFVLRYYMRNNECVSYPYGHCVNDVTEPELFRYKEECEQACLAPGNLGVPLGDSFETYGTVGPLDKSVVNPSTRTPITQTPLPTTVPPTTVPPTTVPPTTVSHSTTVSPSTTVRSTTPSTTTSSTQEPRTECERRRQLASSSLIKGGFIPECDVNGSFIRTQCEPDGRQCFCVDEQGIEVSNSRTRDGSTPDCHGIVHASSPRTNECVGIPLTGPCSSNLVRWHYDEEAQECKRFAYSGCGGNGNNYESEEMCRERCVPVTVECPRGLPLRSTQGYYVNCAKQSCPSGYQCHTIGAQAICCEEEKKSEVDNLRSEVAAGDICAMPKERGPCDKYELRFFFNRETKECKYFFFGGCEGNGNNFARVEDCEDKCGGKRADIPLQTVPPTRPTTVSPTTTSIRTQPPTTVHTTPETVPLPVTQIPIQIVERKDTTEGNRCVHPLDTGNCQGHFVRWFWNEQKANCEVFTYTGCQGNGNNFASREECLSICNGEALARGGILPTAAAVTNVCKHDVDAGECNGVFQRFAFDAEAGECRPFTYGGCGGNGNNFATIVECKQRCQHDTVSGDVCTSSVESGECSGVFQRFAFDRAMGDCRPFNYGGCGGNGNNFASLGECRGQCTHLLASGCSPKPACDLQRCQLLLDVRGCPFCSCPPNRDGVVPPVTECPPIDPSRCVEPCTTFTNRLGCTECSCPREIESIHPSQSVPIPSIPHSTSPSTTFSPPSSHSTTSIHATSVHISPPSPHNSHSPSPPSPSSPPSPPSSPSPPAPSRSIHHRQEAVTIHDTHDKPLPPPISSSKSSSPIKTPAKTLTVVDELGEKCLQPLDAGPCDRFIERFYFDSKDGKCHSFRYGGCAGNRNHFFSQRECEIHCARFSNFLAETDPNLAMISQHLSDHSDASLPFMETPGTIQSTPSTPTPSPSTTSSSSSSSLHRGQGGSSSSSINDHPTFKPIPIEEIMQWAIEHEGAEATAGPKKSIKTKTVPTTTRTVPTTTRIVQTTTRRVPTTTRTVPTRPVTIRTTTHTVEEPKRHEGKTRVDESVDEPIKKIASSIPSIEGVIRVPNPPRVIVPQDQTLPKEIFDRFIHDVDTFHHSFVKEKNDSSSSDVHVITPTKKLPLHRIIGGNTLLPTASTSLPSSLPTIPPTVPPTHSSVSSVEEGSIPHESASPVHNSPEQAIQGGLEVNLGSSEDISIETKEITSLPTSSQSINSISESTTTSIPLPPSTFHPFPTAASTFAPFPVAESTFVPFPVAESTFAPVPTPASTFEPIPTPSITLSPFPQPIQTIKEDKKEEGVFPVPSQMENEYEEEEGEEEGDDSDILPSTETIIDDTTTPSTPSTPSTTIPSTTTYIPVPVLSDGPGRQPVPDAPIGIAAITEELPLADPNAICALSAEAGPCFNYSPRWYFNKESSRCEQFSYGGCGGNGNNFAERKTCEVRCGTNGGSSSILSQIPEKCTLPKDIGTGGGFASKWFFSMKSLRCEQFIFEGVGGNDNQFESLSDCEKLCTPSSDLNEEANEPLSDEDEEEDYEGDGEEPTFGSDDAIPPKSDIHPLTSIDDSTDLTEKTPSLVPAVHASKTVQKNYHTDPIRTIVDVNGQELPIVAPSPPETINYQTGHRANGIKTFAESNGRVSIENAGEIEEDDDASTHVSQPLPSCPNSAPELKYADGRPVMCLPGKNQCPDKSVCYFNGLDYFCCPEDEDPYDKHVFGGYNGEETKQGYKRFGHLNIRRLRDSVIDNSRRKRDTTGLFSLDPLRFDGAPIKQISSARSAKAIRRHPGNKKKTPCDYSLEKGECAEQHLRYFYDKPSDSCRLFHYSGCNGNANNFGSIGDCQDMCVKGVKDASIEQQKISSHLPPGTCPSGEPLGGSAPVLCGNTTESIGCPKGYFCRQGPPDVCCPNLSLNDIISASSSSEIAVKESEKVKNIPTPTTTTTTTTKGPQQYCPDASDPLLTKGGKVRTCGSGFDGLKMCPKGFYCAINADQGSRLCCPILGSSSRIPYQHGVIPPYFGKRNPNSGEVIERGSLPADQKNVNGDEESVEMDKKAMDDFIVPKSPKGSSLERFIDEAEVKSEEEEDDELARMMIKSTRHQEEQREVSDIILPSIDTESSPVHLSNVPTPILDSETTVLPKETFDRSRCQMRPDEGRPCREDEVAPRTNLHYFYSEIDARCKLYFYKGCGGNENRFERKADCEATCMA